MTVGAALKDRRMFPEKGPSPLGMAGIAVLIDAVLFELRRVWRSMGVVAVRAGHFAFAQGHMGRTHQLRLSLWVTLAAQIYLSPFVEERRPVVNLCELIAVGRLLHNRMTIDTS